MRHSPTELANHMPGPQGERPQQVGDAARGPVRIECLRAVDLSDATKPRGSAGPAMPPEHPHRSTPHLPIVGTGIRVVLSIPDERLIDMLEFTLARDIEPRVPILAVT